MHRTKTDKAKITTPKTEKHEKHRPLQKAGANNGAYEG
jgi:hypothetical protein